MMEISEPFQIALIGVGAAVLGALLTAFLQPVLTNLFGKRSKLTVEIVHSPFALPKFLTDSIDAYIYNYRSKIRPTEEAKDKLRAVKNKGGMSSIKILNRSKKSIEDIVVYLDGDGEFVCDLTINGQPRPSEFTKTYAVGTLRAGGECNLTLWTSVDFTGRWHSQPVVKVSAKEYDTIKVSLPPPEYISAQKLLVSRKLFWNAFWCLLLVVNLNTCIQIGRLIISAKSQ